MKSGSKYFLCCVIVSLSIFNLTNCKKYPEDPHRSLRSTKARYTGSWNINYIKINGTDFTQSYADSMGLGKMSDMRINNSYGAGYSRGSKEWRSEYLFNGDNVITDHPTIDEKSETIWNNITFISSKISGAPLQRLYSDRPLTWKILRLYKGKMIIEKEKGSDKYEICYEQTK